MKVLDLTLPTPEENLACDEALLDAAEAGQSGEVLRFWESPEHFVVVGYANNVATEVNAVACEARGIRILRRCSGGGTVVQGPGCLNYTLVLQITEGGHTRNISASNEFIMERNRVAVESAISNRQSVVSVCGHTDLAMNGLKFSGNSQRRRKNFLLFHGTFLLTFNLALVSEVLRMPSQQPDYRADRVHGEFITNLELPAQQIKTSLQAAWEVTDVYSGNLQPATAALVRLKYSTAEWNRKF